MGKAPDYRAIFSRLVEDPRYQTNLEWGKPRPGHPEGIIRAHIAELETNLQYLHRRLSDEAYWKLKLLIHAHDTFKPQSRPEISISHPKSHASLARAFLSEYCDDPDLLAIVQYHDVPFALYRQFESKRRFDQDRLNTLLSAIRDWELFLAFLIIDGGTAGKPPGPLQWFFARIRGRVSSQFTGADILAR
ncbi:MAG: hypothetical protein QOJ99_304 [Bryobacterales bacterium]|jgi:hypothetical protein|nr:hypothetical protein [Bryobacterales bacterium]